MEYSGGMKNDAVLRVLAKITGTLEVMEKEAHCAGCKDGLVVVGKGEYNVSNTESNSSK